MGNFPVAGKLMFPLHNKKSIFAKPGWYYPKVHKIPYAPNSGKIAIFGLPKSGNTWIVSLLSDYLNVPGVGAYGSEKCGVTMLHDPLSYRIKIRSDFQRGVYIVRDVRDIVVSYFHYVQTDYYKELNDPFVAYPDIETFYTNYFLPKLTARYDWLNHTREYVEHGLPMIRYEDLYDNPEQALADLIVRMGLPLDQAKVNEVIEKNRLEKLAKSGKKLWHKVPTTHFRKGGYGGYKDAMSDKLIARINHDFGDVLGRWGYEL